MRPAPFLGSRDTLRIDRRRPPVLSGIRKHYEIGGVDSSRVRVPSDASRVILASVPRDPEGLDEPAASSVRAATRRCSHRDYQADITQRPIRNSRGTTGARVAGGSRFRDPTPGRPPSPRRDDGGSDGRRPHRRPGVFPAARVIRSQFSSNRSTRIGRLNSSYMPTAHRTSEGPDKITRRSSAVELCADSAVVVVRVVLLRVGRRSARRIKLNRFAAPPFAWAAANSEQSTRLSIVTTDVMLPE